MKHQLSFYWYNLLHSKWVGIAVVACALLSLTLFGIVGVGRGGSYWHYDMGYLHASGTLWLNAQSPYEAGAIAPLNTFAYPPTVAPLSMFLALLPVSAAIVVMTILNVTCLILFAICMTRLAALDQHSTRNRTLAWFVAAIIIGNPFATHVVWLGQTTFIAGLAILGAWLLSHRGSIHLAGVCLAIASIKPQLNLLPAIWIIVHHPGSLPAGIITGLALAAWPMIVEAGPFTLLHSWFAAIERYQSDPLNQIAFEHIFGLRSTIHVAFGYAPNLMPLGFALAAYLYFRRNLFNEAEKLSILLVISVLFLYAHDYDLALITASAAPLATYIVQSPWRTLIGSILMLVLFFPQRFVRQFDIALLVRYRELVVVILLLTFFRVAELRHKTRSSDNESERQVLPP